MSEGVHSTRTGREDLNIRKGIRVREIFELIGKLNDTQAQAEPKRRRRNRSV